MFDCLMPVCLKIQKAWQRMSGVDFFKFENVSPESEDLLFAAGDLDISMFNSATTTRSRLAFSGVESSKTSLPSFPHAFPLRDIFLHRS